jgi:D-3-phosphoglycerate dehydrogenase
LSKPRGKVKTLESLKLLGEITVVGDGYADYEIREAGLAQAFVAFTENVKREKVMEKADYIAEDFSKVMEIFHKNSI